MIVSGTFTETFSKPKRDDCNLSLQALSILGNFADSKTFVNLQFTLSKWPTFSLFDIIDFIKNKSKTLTWITFYFFRKIYLSVKSNILEIVNFELRRTLKFNLLHEIQFACSDTSRKPMVVYFLYLRTCNNLFML